MKQSVIIDSGSNGHGMGYPNKGDRELVITHNAGFFSCCTIALQDIIIYHRGHKALPAMVDRGMQFSYYKENAAASLIPLFFEEKEFDIPYDGWYELHHDKDNESQFADYKKIDFASVTPFIDKYFNPSQHVRELVEMYETKYNIDYEHTIGVFYRGNDKNKETCIASYDEFINKVAENEIQSAKDGKPLNRFFVLPDEVGFMDEMIHWCKDRAFTIEELPICENKDSAMFFELPYSERAGYAAKFLAAVIVMSKCKHLITHSGNCGLWATLYRGNADNLHQWQHDRWV